jgi:hypothetical protein
MVATNVTIISPLPQPPYAARMSLPDKSILPYHEVEKK